MATEKKLDPKQLFVDVNKELAASQTLLLLMPGPIYNEVVVDVLKQLAGKSICYITLNKTFDSLKELFAKNKIDTKNIIYIDAISKTIKETPDQTTGCYFCTSPAALTEISIAVSKFLEHGFNYIIFDSLTNLLIYEKREPVAKFVANLVAKIKASKTKAIFYALSVKEQQALIEEAEMFVDKVVYVKEEGREEK